jgi:hypothetical protein
MCDVFKDNYDYQRYKQDVVVDDNHCLQYIKKLCVDSEVVVFTLHITNKVLKSWKDLKEKYMLYKTTDDKESNS